MTKKVCDSCKHEIDDDFVSILYGFSLVTKKDFCLDCHRSSAEYLRSLFDQPPREKATKN